MEKTVQIYTRSERIKITALAVFGSYVEWYDYFVAATAAALVWPAIFFSAFPVLGTAFSIAAFGVSYFTRPLGAYVFGHFGDKYGRKSSLIFTLLTVGIGMIGISALPSATAIGLAAPILLFIFRAIQGMGFGGEYGGAATWVLEVNAMSKWRATWTSLTMAVIGLGSATGAGLYVYLSSIFSRQDLLNFWWRVPFIIGVILLFSAALIRYFALESNIFVKLKQEGKVLKNPANVAVKKHIGLMLLIATTWLYIFWTNPALIQLFATPFLAKHGIPSIYVTYTLLISNIIIFFTTILGGFLSDLVGRRTTIVLSALLVAIFVYPYTILIQSGNLLYILIAQILINAFAFIGEGAFTAYFPEIYRAQYRYTGSGMSYQFAAMYMGFVYSFGLPYIVSLSNPIPVVIGVTLLFCILSLIVRLKVWQETRGVDISD
jgi:Major Facilitator Superfamily.